MIIYFQKLPSVIQSEILNIHGTTINSLAALGVLISRMDPHQDYVLTKAYKAY